MATPVTLKIKFKSPTVDHFVERYSVDISEGGIFIRTPKPLTVGSTVSFQFQLQDGSPLMLGKGTVVWIRELDPAKAAVSPGMGVRFDKLDGDSQQVLDRVIAYKQSAEQFSEEPTVAGDSQQAVELAGAAAAADAIRRSTSGSTTHLGDNASDGHEPTIESSQASVARRLKEFVDASDQGSADAAARGEELKHVLFDLPKEKRRQDDAVKEAGAEGEAAAAEAPATPAMPGELSAPLPAPTAKRSKENASWLIWLIIVIALAVGIVLFLQVRREPAAPVTPALVSDPAASAPAAAAEVTLGIGSMPAGAKIFLDGKDTGEVTPATLSQLDPEREVELRFELAGKKPVTRRLKPAGTESISVDLSEEIERVVRFVSDPQGATVYLDGQKLGETPFEHAGDLSADGGRSITVRLAGHRDRKLDVGRMEAAFVPDGDREVWTLSLKLDAAAREPAPRAAPKPARKVVLPLPAPAVKVPTVTDTASQGGDEAAPAADPATAAPAASVPPAEGDTPPRAP